MKRTFYLAYGANTNFPAMAQRCPRAVYVGNVMLPNLKMVFRGVADVVDAKESKTNVHLALWSITKTDEDALDKFEGFPHFYVKRYFEIEDEGEKVKAMMYVMRSPNRFQSLPSEWYERCLREGYEQCGLPVEQIDTAIARVIRREQTVPELVLPKGIKPHYAARKAHTEAYTNKQLHALSVLQPKKTKLQKLAEAANLLTRTPDVRVTNAMQAALARALGLRAIYNDKQP